MTQEVIITIGLPGSGKSTWAKTQIGLNSNYKIVCRDDLRAMLDNGDWNGKNEEIILRARDKLIYTLLDAGKSVIVADTNLSEKVRNRIKQIVEDFSKTTGREIKVTEKSFLDVPVATCIERDLKRPNSVGSKVILDMANSLKIDTPEPKFVYNGLPEAYIVDIDGTLAKMNGRGPFEWNKVDTDLVRNGVAETVRRLGTNSTIIVLSGRDGVCKELTEKWLNENEIPHNYFFMRAKNDMRSDDIVKEELYRQNIEGKFNVIAAIDDRPRVIRLWKRLGITVFDVGDGIEF